MPEIDEQHTPQPAPPDRGASAAAAESREVDPLSSLHRMSRTAGLGGQDYVAINPTAVVALILGFASALSLLFSVMLIIPIAGVICALIALWQIRDSNGTQTGRALAWGGLLLSVGFAVVVGLSRYAERQHVARETQAIVQTVEEFGRRLMAEDFAGAYELTGPNFQQRVPLSEFQEQFRLRFSHPRHGKVTSFKSNARVMLDEFEETGAAFATTVAMIELEAGFEDRQQVTLVKTGDQWQIEEFGWFPLQGTGA